MSIIKACLIAFGTYSRIPVPNFKWKEKEMKYAICFFPLVGAVIGAAQWLWLAACDKYGAALLLRSVVAVLINILITGGIHMDGYMDTMDAIHSCRSREEKLMILKDPHIGAFAALSCVAYMLLYAGILTEVGTGAYALYAFTFVLSRIISAISALFLRNAKDGGMLYAFSSPAKKGAAGAILFMQLAACCLAMLYFGGARAVVEIAVMAVLFIYYKHKSYKEFGGITGDLAGWFLCLCEIFGAACCMRA